MKRMLIGLSLLGAAICAPAHAAPYAASVGYARTFPKVSAPAPQTLTVAKHVAYGDLDLQRIGDAEKLYDRLERAAKSVCRSHARRAPIAVQSSRRRRCEQAAVADAVAGLEAPLLTSLYAGRSRRAPTGG